MLGHALNIQKKCIVVSYICTVALCILVSTFNASALASDSQPILTLYDLSGKRVAVQPGTSFGDQLAALGIVAKIQYYTAYSDSLHALRTGKVDAFVFDDTILRYTMGNDKTMRILPPVASQPVALAMRKNAENLAVMADAVLIELKNSGELDRIWQKWTTPGNMDTTLPKQQAPANAPVLRLGTDADIAPFAFMAHGKPVGYEIELSQCLANALGMRLEIVLLDFSAFLPALISGRVDIIAGSIGITPERAESVRFLESTAEVGMAALIMADAEDAAKNMENDAAHPPTTAPLSVSASGKPIYRSLYDFNGIKLASSTGSSHPEVLSAMGIHPEMFSFATNQDGIIALRQKRVEGFVNDDVILNVVFGNNPDFTILPSIAHTPMAFVLSKNNEELAKKIDLGIQRFRESGELQKMQDKWLTPSKTGKTREAGKKMPALPPPPPNAPRLRLAVASASMPFAYVDNGNIVGYEVELAARLAHSLGMRLEIQNMDFSGLLPAVLSDRADMAAGTISVTEERAQTVRFSEPTARIGMTAIIRTENAGGIAPIPVTPPAPPSSWAELKRSFERNLIEEARWRMILRGIQETIVISLASLILGTALGGGITAMRRSASALPRYTAMLFIRIMQGTPIVVLLMIFYYIVFAKAQISGTAVAIIAFSCNFAAYAAEIFRTSLDSLDKGQQEAATALGFTRWQTFRRVVLPQAAHVALPVFKGEFISMVKMTSVVGYVAVLDLTKMSDLIRSRTYEPFFPLILTAVIYFVISYVFVLLLNYIETRIDPRQRKRCIAGVRTTA